MEKGFRHRHRRLGIGAAALTLTLGLSLPGFSLPVGEPGLERSVEAFTDALRLAREEAMRAGRTVVVSSRSPREPGDWGRGGTVWSDGDGDGVYDPDESLRVIASPPPFASLRAVGGTSEFRYLPDGTIDRADDLDLCTRSGNGRRISVTATGRVIQLPRSCS